MTMKKTLIKGINVKTKSLQTGDCYTKHLEINKGAGYCLREFYNLSENDLREHIAKGFWRITKETCVSKMWVDLMYKHNCQLLVVKSLKILLFVDSTWSTIYRIEAVNISELPKDLPEGYVSRSIRPTELH